MTAALHHDDVVTLAPARNLRLVHATPTAAAPAKTVARQQEAGHFGAGDPLVTGAAKLLSIPVRHVYAALWRVGIIEVTA
jgi:hypothetical protein